MVLPRPVTSWMQDLGVPSQILPEGWSDFDLFEEEDEFVLTIEMPGFDLKDINLNYYEGRLHVSAEHVDEERGRKKTFHRTLRLPKEIDEDKIEATYRNGVLEVTLPIEGEVVRGTSIPIKGEVAEA
ncbi:MAG: Hsp20/alpha crystallin family protein [Halobacteria archaeon]|nr:Hsp20/alpha crystallin family protein [Halobacteria archaeon]